MKKRREHLIEVRKENKMFQKDVVKMIKSEFNIEISESYYGMIEQGARTPSLEIAMAISEIFGKKVEDIFLYDKPNKMLRSSVDKSIFTENNPKLVKVFQ